MSKSETLKIVLMTPDEAEQRELRIIDSFSESGKLIGNPEFDSGFEYLAFVPPAGLTRGQAAAAVRSVWSSLFKATVLRQTGWRVSFNNMPAMTFVTADPDDRSRLIEACDIFREVLKARETMETRRPPNGAGQVRRLRPNGEPARDIRSLLGLGRKHTDADLDAISKMLDTPGETFMDKLFQYIDERELNDVDVYTSAYVSKQVFSTLNSNRTGSRPSKMTALALALTLRLNLEQVEDLLSRAQYSLSPANESDMIIKYCIEHEIFNLIDISEILAEYGLKGFIKTEADDSYAAEELSRAGSARKK